MVLERCKAGIHLYDSSKSAECPYCQIEKAWQGKHKGQYVEMKDYFACVLLAFFVFICVFLFLLIATKSCVAAVSDTIVDAHDTGAYSNSYGDYSQHLEDVETFRIVKSLIGAKQYVGTDQVSAYSMLKPLVVRGGDISKKAVEQIHKIIAVADSYIDAGAWKAGLEMLEVMQDTGSGELDKLVRVKLLKVGNKYREKARLLMSNGIGTTSVDYLEKALRANQHDLEARKLLASAQKITGTLAIFSAPSSKVVIDGVDMRCIAPVDGIRLLAGKHTLMLTPVDQVSSKSSLTEILISPGKKTRVIYENNDLVVIH